MFPSYKNNPRRFLFGDLIGILLPGLTVLIIVFAVIRISWYAMVPQPDLKGESAVYLCIPTGSDFSTVRNLLVSKAHIRHPEAFTWLANRKKYPEKVKPGRYKIADGMRNNELINLLRSGRQEAVRIIIQNFRTPEELAGRIGKSLEIDSARLIRLFRDDHFLEKYGLTQPTLFIYFIPDTYHLYWNTSGDGLFRRMEREFGKFWNGERRRKADSLKMTIPEIVTLASIVEKETNKIDEKPRIAGVYYNRLRNNIPLQADPAIIFAWKDYSIRRVLNFHLKINSPYNTYLHTGLPPGPICITSIASVDAALRPENHEFLYFCAREDLSGYHSFARTLGEHNLNARKYQHALDTLNIKR
jgi:UPF0755 protein